MCTRHVIAANRTESCSIPGSLNECVSTQCVVLREGISYVYGHNCLESLQGLLICMLGIHLSARVGL